MAHGKGKKTQRMPKKVYEQELLRLQAELVKLQEWVRVEGARVVVIFEGRDAAGKGSTIKRVTEYLNPRVARIAALPAPTERQREQWYFQRYVEHLPAAGEIVLFDRSWYNRAGVERVMGFCTNQEYTPLPAPVPDLRAAAGRGRHPAAQVLVLGQRQRAGEPLPQPRSRTRCAAGSSHRWTWSRSPAGRTTRAPRTRCSSTPTSPKRPWYVVESEDKRSARINMIAHLLSHHPVLRGRSGRRSSLPPRPPSKATSGRRARCRPTSPTTPSTSDLIGRSDRRGASGLPVAGHAVIGSMPTTA